MISVQSAALNARVNTKYTYVAFLALCRMIFLRFVRSVVLATRSEPMRGSFYLQAPPGKAIPIMKAQTFAGRGGDVILFSPSRKPLSWHAKILSLLSVANEVWKAQN